VIVETTELLAVAAAERHIKRARHPRYNPRR
jgi:hypothetical protein